MHAARTWRLGIVAVAALAGAGCDALEGRPYDVGADASPAAPPAPTAADLARRIAGTTWEWCGDRGPVTFGSDGFCRLADWDRMGLVTSWKAIDGHSVLLTIERGREQDRYAVCVFNDDFTEYGGFNFHRAEPLDVSRRVQGK